MFSDFPSLYYSLHIPCKSTPEGCGITWNRGECRIEGCRNRGEITSPKLACSCSQLCSFAFCASHVLPNTNILFLSYLPVFILFPTNPFFSFFFLPILSCCASHYITLYLPGISRSLFMDEKRDFLYSQGWTNRAITAHSGSMLSHPSIASPIISGEIVSCSLSFWMVAGV